MQLVWHITCTLVLARVYSSKAKSQSGIIRITKGWRKTGYLSSGSSRYNMDGGERNKSREEEDGEIRGAHPNVPPSAMQRMQMKWPEFESDAIAS